MSYTIEQLDCAVKAAVVVERERCAKVCEQIEEDMWCAYMGRPPYGPDHPLANDAHTQGLARGARCCAVKIREIK